MDWQDIVTAPKLEPVVNPDAFLLVGAPGRPTRQVWWEGEHGWVTGFHDGHPVTLGYEPTHWMPLPAAPPDPKP